MESEPKLLVGLRDAARMLSVSQRTLWQLAADGALPSVRIRRRLLFSPASLQRWIAERESAVTEGRGEEHAE